MLFKLRQYKVNPGRQADWVRIMEEQVIPFQTSKGMVAVGSFVGEEDESVHVWIRRFENEAERERLYEAVFQSEHWKNEIAPRIEGMLDSEAMQVTRLTPTPGSVIH